VSPRDPAPGRARLVIHASTPDIGGAEASLLAAVADAADAAETAAPAAAAAMASGGVAARQSPVGIGPLPPLFLVPAEGPLARAVAARGWEARVLPWPRGYAGLTQTRWRALLLSPGFMLYSARLALAMRGAGQIWSSGAKSHAACLLLSPWLGPRLRFDVRDFLRTRLLRKALAFAAARFGCRIFANSLAVAAGYPGAEVRYPRVSLARPPVDRRPREGRRIVTHLAYFAPYKGQDLFLRCARAMLDAGIDAEFRLIGDVLYPAPAYARYRRACEALAVELGLVDRVRFLGKLAPEAVQTALEETHLLLHCTTEPEPFGRAPMEAMLCGCEVICHRGSGVCEVAEILPELPPWAGALRPALGADYVSLRLKAEPTGNRREPR
jgi:glycosyltransferase involved in cell wall biosynthesis